jgi:hypothetical protein
VDISSYWGNVSEGGRKMPFIKHNHFNLSLFKKKKNKNFIKIRAAVAKLFISKVWLSKHKPQVNNKTQGSTEPHVILLPLLP